MKQFFKPLVGCRILASNQHHRLNEFDYIGRVVAVDGNIVKFKDCEGDTDSVIWRFKEGNNKSIVFVA